ncbi:MAG: phosphoribosylglycinamide formyltransferase [Gemmatimonadaceae bacterium]
MIPGPDRAAAPASPGSPRRARIAVLASGGGSNLGALLAHFDALGDARAGDVVLVASDREQAGALDRARAHGIPTALLRTRAQPEGEEMLPLLDRHAIDLVVLAGYLRLVPQPVVRRWHGRIVNVHPGPRPELGGTGLYGAGVHDAILRGGAARWGATVHFVDVVYDHGATIAHEPVPVLPDDTPASLAARVLEAEHRIFPRVVQALAAGELRLREDGSVECK